MAALSKEAFLDQLAKNGSGSPEHLRLLFERALEKLGWSEKAIFSPEELALVGIAMAHQATTELADSDIPEAHRTGRTLEALLSKAEEVLGPALHRPSRPN